MTDKAHRYYSDSIYWVEVNRIVPNPYQPRRSFDEAALRSLAESIRQYGVLQPLTVTKKEIERPDEGIAVEYELIAGERRLRAAKIAGVSLVPVVMRNPEESDKMKLELAIIENLQREDLNAVDRAKAFQQLAAEFGMTHTQVAQKVGRSREYVSNTLRILLLSEEMQQALVEGRISDGHTRPLLMLADKPEQQMTLFKEIITTHMSVRESERVARRIAVDKTRKHDLTPELLSLEREFTERLGTRVRIERKEHGGKLLIDFFSEEDLSNLRDRLSGLEEHIAAIVAGETAADSVPESIESQQQVAEAPPAGEEQPVLASETAREPIQEERMGEPQTPVTPAPEQETNGEDDLYSVRNFSV